jgi:hypothetical protein
MMTRELQDVRTLRVVLREDEWQALRAVEPDAVGWLKARVRERLALPDSPSAPGAAERVQAGWISDEN